MIKHRMVCRWRGLAITAILLITAVSPALAQRAVVTSAGSLPADEQKEGIERASCVLMLRGSLRGTNPGMGGGGSPVADLNALTTAMTTTGLIDPSAKAALGLGPREWPKVARIEVTPAGAQAVKLSVSVDPGPNELKQDDPAGLLLRDLIGRAKAVVSQAVEPRRQEVKARLEELEKRRVELRTSLDGLRKRVRDAEAAYSRGPVLDPVSTQRRQYEIELANKRHRLQAIRDALPRFATQPDGLASALKGLVAAREALIAGLEKAQEQGKVEPLELLRARADLAEAKVRVAESDRGPSIQSGRSLRDEQISLEVDIATLEAQLKAVAGKTAEPPQTSVEDAQLLRAESFRSEGEYNILEQQYQQARREYDLLGSPPTLIVLDGQKKD